MSDPIDDSANKPANSPSDLPSNLPPNAEQRDVALASSQFNVMNNENAGDSVLSAYDKWELPSMDVEDDGSKNAFAAIPRPASAMVEEEEEIQPLTAEEVEAVRQAAYDEGIAEGIKDGYDKGYKSGADDVRAMMTKMSQICRALLEPISTQDDEIEQALMGLTKTICGQVIQRELQLDASSLNDVIKETLDCLHAGAKRIRIHLNPDDVAFIQNSLESMEGIEFTWKLLPHPTISPGGCIVETEKSMVDARAETRLSAVIQQVYSKQEEALEDDYTSNAHGGLDQLLGEVDRFENSEQTGDKPELHFTPDNATPNNATPLIQGSPPDNDIDGESE